MMVVMPVVMVVVVAMAVAMMMLVGGKPLRTDQRHVVLFVYFPQPKFGM
jgi:hypothetical protein